MPLGKEEFCLRSSSLPFRSPRLIKRTSILAPKISASSFFGVILASDIRVLLGLPTAHGFLEICMLLARRVLFPFFVTMIALLVGCSNGTSPGPLSVQILPSAQQFCDSGQTLPFNAQVNGDSSNS